MLKEEKGWGRGGGLVYFGINISITGKLYG